MKIRLPLYILQLFVIHVTIMLNPKFHHGVIEYQPQYLDAIVTFFNYVAVISSVVMLVLQPMYGDPRTFITYIWNYFELGYIIESFILASIKTRYTH